MYISGKHILFHQTSVQSVSPMKAESSLSVYIEVHSAHIGFVQSEITDLCLFVHMAKLWE